MNAVTEDSERVARLKAGDTGALGQLIGRWRPRAEAYAQTLLGDRQAAEDAVLEAFARIWAVRKDLDPGRSFQAYLFTVVRRICIDELRKRKRFPELPGELPELPSASAEEEYFTREERLERVRLLAGLDEEERRLLLAFALENKPTKQIAREMNLTDGQVRVRLHRIRKKLRKGRDRDAR